MGPGYPFDRRSRSSDQPATGHCAAATFRTRLWAAGYYGRSAALLVAWVASFAIIRGVRDIVLAFRVYDVQHPQRGV